MVTLDKEKNNTYIFQINYLVLTPVSILISSGYQTMGRFGVFFVQRRVVFTGCYYSNMSGITLRLMKQKSLQIKLKLDNLLVLQGKLFTMLLKEVHELKGYILSQK